jgi:RNA polymerase sigma factor (sigma-70 family)
MQATPVDTDVITDAELIARVRAGDLSAERALYLTHAPVAIRLARQNGAQHADAEDYVSEAFLRVLRQLRLGRGPHTHFRSYLLTAVHNVAIDSHKGQSGREWATDTLEDRTSYSADTRDPQELVEVRAAITSAMHELPQRWRQVLWQVEVEGAKPAAVAEQEGATAQSIHALVYRARKALRAAYVMD